MKYSGIGGQAVIEGIMMRNGDRYSVAVRKPDKEIEVAVTDRVPLTSRFKFAGLPFIRMMRGRNPAGLNCGLTKPSEIRRTRL